MYAKFYVGCDVCRWPYTEYLPLPRNFVFIYASLQLYYLYMAKKLKGQKYTIIFSSVQKFLKNVTSYRVQWYLDALVL